MQVFTVTTGSDDPATGLTLREACARAEAANGGGLVVFAEGINLISLQTPITIRSGNVTIDGDTNGDGVLDVFIGRAAGATTHHFNIRPDATVTLRDLGLYNGRSFASDGADGANGTSSGPTTAGDGADGVQRSVGAGAGDAAIAAEAALLGTTRVDGRDGQNGLDGQDGAAGDNGRDAAGSIVNEGNLTLVRTGLFYNEAVGGDGGDGGNGAAGQHGGDGGDGAVGAVELANGSFAGTVGAVDSGAGGAGGNGGDGGAGGIAGRGGDAAGAILNRSTGTLTLIDTTFGGRMAHGFLADQYGNNSIGGNGGEGGNGAQGGNGGFGGYGADDVFTVAAGDATYTGDIFDMMYAPGTGEVYDYLWFGIIETRLPGQSMTSRAYDESALADGRFRASTDAGRGGAGGDAGDGGAAGGNGSGGHSAPLINYGTVSGHAAFGTANSVDGGEGDPSDFTDFTGTGGQAGTSRNGRGGGAESTEYFWTQRPIAYVLGQYESWASGDPSLIGEFGTSGGGYGYAVGLPSQYDAPGDAPDGRDGRAGVAGDTGQLGRDGRENVQMVSEGTARDLERSDDLVYLTGVRQDAEFNQLLFSIVRVGDTSAAVTVTYEVFGIGKTGVRDNDFTDPTLLAGTIDFAAIDQQASTVDSTGAGIAQIALDLSLGQTGEGAEAFRIVLRSGDVALGTNVYTGSLFDGDYTRLIGSRGNDRRLNGTDGADAIEGREGDDRIDARKGNDYVLGGAGRDTVTGGRGNDVLLGGEDADRFVFAGSAGNDRIGDFAAGDRIDLTAYAITFADLTIADVRGGAQILYDGGKIVVEGVAAAAFDAADFLFA